MIGGFLQRISNILTNTDNINIILVIVAVALVASLVTPEVVPEADLGARCTNLPNARGGNRQSLLAQGSQNMAISLDIVDALAREGDEVTIAIGEPITLRVTFINNDAGPITLFWNEEAAVVGNIDALSQGVLGIVIEFEAQLNDSILTDSIPPEFIQPNPAATVPQYTYDLEDLYLLRASGKCFVDIRLSSEQIQRIGLTVGEYRVRAYYQNQDQGIYIPPTPNEPDPTATPMFDNANVWSGGRLTSNRIVMIVQ